MPGVLRNYSLAARQTTNILLLDFSSCLGELASNKELLATLAQALEISGAKLLELDSRELGTMVIPAGEQGCALGAVIYDNVPGGAGHVRELLSLSRPWLEEARKVMFVDEQHDATCETACLDCLLTFDAQEPMRRGLLHRKMALQALDALLAGNEPPIQEHHARTIQVSPDIATTEAPLSADVATLSAEERLQRGQQRLAARDQRKKRTSALLPYVMKRQEF